MKRLRKAYGDDVWEKYRKSYHRNGYDILPKFSGVEDASYQLAKIIFDDMRDEQDISHNYPLEGCWARTHVMVVRIQEMYNVEVQKIWAIDLSEDLADNGNGLESSKSVYIDGGWGEYDWEYHVAPLIKIGSTTWVIDPSLADGPISIEEWKSRFHAEGALTIRTNLGEAPNIPPDFLEMDAPIVFDKENNTGFWLGPDPSDDLVGWSLDYMDWYATHLYQTYLYYR